MKKLGIILSFCALTYISGSHLALVQCVAWGQMLVDYSQEAGLAGGISKTFDGEHPCAMCKEVKKAKQEQAPQRFLLKLSELKAPSFSEQEPVTVCVASDTPTYFSLDALSQGIGQQAPLLPPPRA